MGVLALILATLEWVGERMRPPTSLEAPAKTIKTVAIPSAIERAAAAALRDLLTRDRQ
jgi:hypothetical protein